jgi:inositol-phosphate transport system permease protein
MRTSRTLGLVMIAPAAVMIFLFFLMPVVLTAIFAMTNMTTATGISGGAWQVTQGAVNRLKADMPELAGGIAEPRFVIDEQGLAALNCDPATWARSSLLGARPNA